MVDMHHALLAFALLLIDPPLQWSALVLLREDVYASSSEVKAKASAFTKVWQRFSESPSESTH
jgi:hypothetical protein